MLSRSDLASRLAALRAMSDREVARELPAGGVFTARLRRQLEALLEAELTMSATRADAVHDARVAGRRLLAGLAMSGPLIATEATEPLRGELRWLVRSLGVARDRDVVRDRLLHLVHTVAPPPAGVDQLIVQLESGLPEALETGLGAALFGTDRHAALLTTLETFLTDAPWTPLAEQPAAPYLRRAVRQEWRRLVREVTVVTDARPGTPSDEQFHEARKAARRMRYALETVQLVQRRKPRALHAHVRELTELLGERQDTVMTRSALRQLIMRGDGPGVPVDFLAQLHQAEEQRAAELEAAFRVEWVRASEVRLDWP